MYYTVVKIYMHRRVKNMYFCKVESGCDFILFPRTFLFKSLLHLQMYDIQYLTKHQSLKKKRNLKCILIFTFFLLRDFQKLNFEVNEMV